MEYTVNKDSTGRFRVREDAPITEELQEKCFDTSGWSQEERQRDRLARNKQIIYDKLQAGKHRPQFKRMNLDSSNLGSTAAAFARELEYVYSEVLREEYAPNNAFDLFPIDNRVPPGKKAHTVRRVEHRGRARYFRGDTSDKGNVGVQTREKDFPIHPIVTNIEFDMFEALADAHTSASLREELRVAAVQTMMDFKNDKTFSGEESLDIRGIFNYDWLPEYTSSVDFDDRENPQQIIDAVNAFLSIPYRLSKTRFYPDTLVVPLGTLDVWTETYRSAQSDKTILEAIMENNRRLKAVEEADEMDQYGPEGMRSMFAYRAGEMRSVANVIPQDVTFHELQTTGFTMEIPVWMLDGGVVMRNPMNNLLVHWEDNTNG